MFLLVALSPLASVVYAAGFIAYGAFKVMYLSQALKSCGWLLPIAQGPLCPFLRARLAGRHLTFARPWHSRPTSLPARILLCVPRILLQFASGVVALGLQRSVFCFPAFFCSVLWGVVSIGLQ